MTPPDDFELRARRAKWALIAGAQARDPVRTTEVAQVRQHRAERRPEGLALLDAFVAGGDAEVFRRGVDAWSRQPGYVGFGGVSGQMFLNQLLNAGDGDAGATALRNALRAPADAAAAERQLRDVLAYVESVKKGAHPAPARTPFLLSFFWGLQDHDRWPVAWKSAVDGLVRLGWHVSTGDHAADHLSFREAVLDLGEPPDDVEHALYWLETHPFVGLDPFMVGRCERVVELNQRQVDGRYASEADRDAAERSARALVGECKLLGQALEVPVAEAIGRSVKVEVPQLELHGGRYRSDAWARLSVTGAGGSPNASLRVWVTQDGVLVGCHPGWYRDGWFDEARAVVQELAPAGMAIRAVRWDASRLGAQVGTRPGGEFVLGRELPAEAALGRPELAEEIVAGAASLQPVFDALLQQVSTGSGDVSVETEGATDHLEELVERFRTERPYPTERDLRQPAYRQAMAAVLQPDELPLADRSELSPIFSTGRYGNPGPQSNWNRTLRDATPDQLDEILGRLRYLLWGDGPDEERIDRLLDRNDLGVAGLGESGVMKLLAVARPERYVPVFPYSGDMGKARLMRLIGLTPPADDLSRGRRHVLANDAIRERLDRHFPGDPWAMGQLLYWLREAKPTDHQPPEDGADDELAVRLSSLADELLVGEGHLADWVALLEEKGQVVLYGPPGTGKTYLARKLAEALAPDPSTRAIVQFHPSSSYEDFVEGYRPVEGGDGQVAYARTPGPLVRLADAARAARGVRHVLVVDEINRANLPKVLGELLFLLEYRDEEIALLYRPEEPFSLPKNLLVVGTMNTADRSIALVDAALRRRFHFVPFFPDREPMAGLLGRWFEKHDPAARWVAELVDAVNGRLIDELGGPHLQIGPSHFMRTGLDEAGLRRIWTYDVEPFLEDQLYGSPERLEDFRFDNVLADFQRESGPLPPPGA